MTLSLSQYYDMILPQAKTQKIPLSGQFEITPRCNLACKMCYIAKPGSDSRSTREELPTSDWIHLAEEARKAGMLNLLLTGGEVFVRKDFPLLLETLKGMGFLIKIYSNGTLITRDRAAWLGSMKPLSLEVTVYGASPETYAKVTGNPDAFARTIQGIDHLLSEGISLQLRTTVVLDNYQDFEQIARIAEERQVKLGIVNYIMPTRQDTGRISQSLRLPPDLQIAYESKVEDYFARQKQLLIETIDFEEFNKQPEDSSPPDLEDPYRCLAGKTAFWINWKGEMQPCSSISETGIYPLKTGFKTAWKKIREFCCQTPVCKECNECSYRKWCLSCPARLKLETGSFDKPSSYLCELAKKKSGMVI